MSVRTKPDLDLTGEANRSKLSREPLLKFELTRAKPSRASEPSEPIELQLTSADIVRVIADVIDFP